MSNNNNSGKFFKFKNLQLVRRQNSARQTRQNTDIRMQGIAEEQFAAITAAACAEALNDIDDILTDNDSIDYSPPKQQHLDPQVQVQNNNQQPSDSDETNVGTPGSGTDSSSDTSSIEVIQPHEELEIRLPINPPQRAYQTLLKVQGQMLQSPYQTTFSQKMRKQETNMSHSLKHLLHRT